MMEIFLSPNGAEIKVCWRSSLPGAALTKPYSVNANALRKRCEAVRAELTALNDYVRANPKFDERRDPAWSQYSTIMRRLRNEGGMLRAALIEAGQPEDIAEVFDRRVRALPKDTEVTVHCSDQDVTIPLGFICENTSFTLKERPSRGDFDGFWINRLKLSIRLSGTDCATSEAIDRSAFRAIYALNRAEKESVLAELIESDLESERQQFESLTTIDQRDHYDWEDVRSECMKMTNAHAVFFVFAHCDGLSLQLGDSDTVDWARFRNMLRRRADDRSGLVIFNCCTSGIGEQGSSLLSAVTQPGFCGMIGTEAEVHNTGALRCGIRLMWNLCVNGKNLGDAFTDMQNSEDLFPVNLFYTCYAARDFRLNSPITFPV
ncbi:hypothetical protein [Undibacterium terreum]|nr:hypothetical protein [Undibacterium terreum]